MVTRAQVRAYVERPWGQVEASKRTYWAQIDPIQRLELASGLWQHAREHAPGWPDSSRGDDLDHHHELTRRLLRIADALARR